ncbi:MAG: hypothetical protein K6F84_06830 [Lachnospiraceae bacterium]|nr:hypothetical protein [Lachnospiraceae bacterium]
MDFKRKRRNFGIKNLTLIFIALYAVGYLLAYTVPGVFNYILLDPYKIMHGEVWRIVTWLLVPPQSSLDIFTIIMLFFYYSIGTTLEKTLGAERYTIYLLGGVAITVIASFLCLFTVRFMHLNETALTLASISGVGSLYYSTYYLNMSIFFAFAALYPNSSVLLMFIVPVKVKYLGFIYAGWLVWECIISGNPYTAFAVGATFVNFIIFYFCVLKKGRSLTPKQAARKMQFMKAVSESNSYATMLHKCAICGRTSETNPELDFRICSKCIGNREYCNDHLFSHEHFK